MTPRDTCSLPPTPPNDDPAVRARLASSHVALVGCGGLGSNAASMLVRAGVGELTLIDFDVVEESNLNRQLFFRDQLGLPKTEALATTLRRINPDVTLRIHTTCATEANLVGLVDDADVIIEAADRAETKAMIANVLSERLPDTPLVAASGLAGFASANEIVTERFGEAFYLVGDLRSDVRDELPLIASRVMVASAHEAHVAIRLLLGHPEP
ncbi:MAG TPA: sulfur carrier protein ThiS adenylyltransferase ThiF [Coriobacteriia bacterium]|nr:sulfur carrier protein ThiS adenylyltransferase ThiF [Coriobacteriia bacterium]